jgi:hypothetical protein
MFDIRGDKSSRPGRSRPYKTLAEKCDWRHSGTVTILQSDLTWMIEPARSQTIAVQDNLEVGARALNLLGIFMSF